MSLEKKVLKELNEEELEKVNGGCASGECLPADHGAHIGKYDAGNYIGQKFYIVDDYEPRSFYWGTLLDSYEDQKLFFTQRVHKLHIEGKNNYWECQKSVGSDAQFSGDAYTLFLMH